MQDYAPTSKAPRGKGARGKRQLRAMRRERQTEHEQRNLANKRSSAAARRMDRLSTGSRKVMEIDLGEDK